MLRSRPTLIRTVAGPAALVATAAGALAFVTCTRQAPAARQTIGQAQREQLVPFRDDEELLGYLRATGERQRARYFQLQAGKQEAPDGGPGPGSGAIDLDDGAGAPATAEAPAPSAPSPAPRPSRRAAEGSRSAPAARQQQGRARAGAGDSITNTQEEGIDEGDIVKAHGDQLIVLRRGRLFSLAVGGGQLRPIDAIDTYPAGAQPASWYDEMLIHDDTIVVVGYSYQASGTEIGLFHVDDAGHLAHRATYYLKSNDYYSARNYASRLLGDRLLFYMPYFVLERRWERGSQSFLPSLPSIRRFSSGSTAQDGWRTIVRATEVYRPIQETETLVLHTVVSCDLSTQEPTCTARGVLGPYGRTFYVSSTAVYVWVSSERRRGGPPEQRDPDLEGRQWNGPVPSSVLYRLPLDNGAPGALRAWGVPTDQFSFQERDGRVNVLLRAEGGGDMMWGSEVTAGSVALLRAPVAALTAGVGSTRASDYLDLPHPGPGYAFQNRFVGDDVLYGNGTSWGPPAPSARRVFVHRVGGARRGAEVLELPHGVDRIEPLGDDAVVVGTDGRDLHFTSLRLEPGPSVAGRFVQPNAAQGETRSHGFFFRQDDDEDGVLGLPVRRGGAPGWEQLFRGSAGVLFLRVDALRLGMLGALGASEAPPVADRCVASCVDWYGNARPIFYRGRIYALLGYELVEGRVARGALREVRRADMASAIRPAR